MRYFIGNWKMFGIPKSINILNKINSFCGKDKNRKKYRVIVTPPYTLIETYAKYFKRKKISPADLKKIMYEKEKIGLAAEEFIFKKEIEKVKEINKKLNVEHIALTDVAAGYDILSYDDKEEKIKKTSAKVK